MRALGARQGSMELGVSDLQRMNKQLLLPVKQVKIGSGLTPPSITSTSLGAFSIFECFITKTIT
jgi:hypothetical protein